MKEENEKRILVKLERVENSLKDLQFNLREMSSFLDLMNTCQLETNKMISEFKTNSN